MFATTLYTLTFATLAAAQSSTVSLFFPSVDNQSGLVGSIAGADASATTYVIGCANVTSASPSAAMTSMGGEGLDAACPFDQSQTIVQGPSTFHWVPQQSALDGAVTLDCSLSGTVLAVCAETASGSALTAAGTAAGVAVSAAASGSAAANAGPTAENAGPDLPPLMTTTLSGSDLPPYQQVVITAGLSNIKAAGASSTGTGSAASGQTGSATSGGSTTASSSGSTAKSSNGAMGGVEPALVMSAAGLLAVGLAAIAL